ncbi:tail fiber protein [Roseibacillus persicicus]|uniref:phage tail protein n=1 Tax=Roseibacillus persicicus TaxID=454148 RepID=UPI00398AFFF4
MEPFIAQITMFGGNFAPRGWALCEGQLLAIASNSALFSILGTTYGGDGRTTFGLPDLRGRAPVQQGTGPGLSNIRLGERGGRENVQLTLANLPAHSHTLSNASVQLGCNNAPGEEDSPVGNYPAANASDEDYAESANATMGAASVTGTIGTTGSSTAFDNRNPYLGINFIIALVGTFPSRN